MESISCYDFLFLRFILLWSMETSTFAVDLCLFLIYFLFFGSVYLGMSGDNIIVEYLCYFISLSWMSESHFNKTVL